MPTVEITDRGLRFVALGNSPTPDRRAPGRARLKFVAQTADSAPKTIRLSRTWRPRAPATMIQSHLRFVFTCHPDWLQIVCLIIILIVCENCQPWKLQTEGVYMCCGLFRWEVFHARPPRARQAHFCTRVGWASLAFLFGS